MSMKINSDQPKSIIRSNMIIGGSSADFLISKHLLKQEIEGRNKVGVRIVADSFSKFSKILLQNNGSDIQIGLNELEENVNNNNNNGRYFGVNSGGKSPLIVDVLEKQIFEIFDCKMMVYRLAILTACDLLRISSLS